MFSHESVCPVLSSDTHWPFFAVAGSPFADFMSNSPFKDTNLKFQGQLNPSILREHYQWANCLSCMVNLEICDSGSIVFAYKKDWDGHDLAMPTNLWLWRPTFHCIQVSTSDKASRSSAIMHKYQKALVTVKILETGEAFSSKNMAHFHRSIFIRRSVTGFSLETPFSPLFPLHLFSSHIFVSWPP